jgi:uncharacterized membrane protein YqjE
MRNMYQRAPRANAISNVGNRDKMGNPMCKISILVGQTNLAVIELSETKTDIGGLALMRGRLDQSGYITIAF